MRHWTRGENVWFDHPVWKGQDLLLWNVWALSVGRMKQKADVCGASSLARLRLPCRRQPHRQALFDCFQSLLEEKVEEDRLSFQCLKRL